MNCEFCDGETLKKKVRRQHWLHGRLYIVGNVEAEVCPECGERYFHATTLDQIDRSLRLSTE
jgi:YgiT-type zinc finger domain-containing protein